ncbi:MAG: hypothetical protein HOC28_01915 [Bacteroidetes Order II. Incertae sedis bacterium]|nr:hypothetical protein [Bacteroidetes Order II. bacterium]
MRKILWIPLIELCSHGLAELKRSVVTWKNTQHFMRVVLNTFHLDRLLQT